MRTEREGVSKSAHGCSKGRSIYAYQVDETVWDDGGCLIPHPRFWLLRSLDPVKLAQTVALIGTIALIGRVAKYTWSMTGAMQSV